jgi:TATA-binding protein-associated factor Taf7
MLAFRSVLGYAEMLLSYPGTNQEEKDEDEDEMEEEEDEEEEEQEERKSKTFLVRAGGSDFRQNCMSQLDAK